MRNELLSAALLGTLLATASVPAAADWLEPRKASDCFMWNPAYGFSSQRDDLRSASQRCVSDNAPWESPWRDNMACSTDTMSNEGPVACASIEEQICRLNRKTTDLRQQCQDRYEAWKTREAAEKKRQADEKKRLEDEERARKAAAAASAAPPGGAVIGHGIGGAVGGGQQLSDTIVNGAIPALNDIRSDAVDRLTAGMDQYGGNPPGKGRPYSATYPRRSRSQIDRPIGMLDHAQRVGQMDNKLPLGHSVVASAYGAMVTHIVEAHANGEIDTPLAAIGIAIASWVAWEASQAEMQMKEEERRRFDASVQAMLPRQQQVARETWEAVRPPEPEPEPVPVPKPVLVPEPQPEPKRKPNSQIGQRPGNCFERRYFIAENGKAAVRYQNNCKYSVENKPACGWSSGALYTPGSWGFFELDSCRHWFTLDNLQIVETPEYAR